MTQQQPSWWNKSACACACVLLSAALAAAEVSTVLDKISVGIHAEKSLQSPILKIFPAGTTLQVLERDGTLVRVNAEDGTRGWVDAQYLTAPKTVAAAPAAAAPPATAEQTLNADDPVAALDAQNRQLADDLKLAREQIAALIAAQSGTPASGSKSGGAAGTALSFIATAELKQLRQRVEDLNTQLAAKSAVPSAAANRDDAAALDMLTRENTALKEALAQAQPDAADVFNWRNYLPAMPAFLTTGITVIGGFLLSPLTWVIGVLCLLIMAFAAGAAWMDYRQRARHGGFRV